MISWFYISWRMFFYSSWRRLRRLELRKLGIQKSSTIRVGVNVQLEFQLTQHIRDESLIKSLIEYLNCGNVHQSKNVFRYRASKFSDLSENIIPFFKKYPIIGIKSKDFSDFCGASSFLNWWKIRNI